MQQQRRQRSYKQKQGTPPAFRLSGPVTDAEIHALRALEKGEATAYQQQLALRCILVTVSGAYDQEFVVGQPDQSAFRGGRAFVGRMVLKMIKTDLDVLLGDEHEDS